MEDEFYKVFNEIRHIRETLTGNAITIAITVSYNRFTESEKSVIVPFVIFVKNCFYANTQE